MNITILTDNPNSWIMPYVIKLKESLHMHIINHIYDIEEIKSGDIMLALSCEKIIPEEYLQLHTSNIVIHPSRVPHGKGWSPLAWQVLEGCNKIPVSLFEAVERVDSGNVYLVKYIELEGNELNDEIKHEQGTLTIKMAKQYIDNFDNSPGISQNGIKRRYSLKETFYPKRTKKDSELDIKKSIKQQFNKLRVVDNERYPAFFIMNGQKYILKVYKDE